LLVSCARSNFCLCLKNIFLCDLSLIGTGASCIYPLLGAKLNSWQFIATDADATNVDYATANVLRNNLADNIKGRSSFSRCLTCVSIAVEGLNQNKYIRGMIKKFSA